MRMALTALNLIKSQTALLKVRKDCSTAPCDSGDTLVESSWQWGLWSVSHQAKTTCRGAAVGAGWVWLGPEPEKSDLQPSRSRQLVYLQNYPRGAGRSPWDHQ